MTLHASRRTRTIEISRQEVLNTAGLPGDRYIRRPTEPFQDVGSVATKAGRVAKMARKKHPESTDSPGSEANGSGEVITQGLLKHVAGIVESCGATALFVDVKPGGNLNTALFQPAIMQQRLADITHANNNDFLKLVLTEDPVQLIAQFIYFISPATVSRNTE